MHYMDDAYELALHLMGKNPENDNDFEDNEDAVDEFLQEKYGIEDPALFKDLLRDLAKLADRSQSPLTEKIYGGFAKMDEKGDGFWLYKIEIQ